MFAIQHQSKVYNRKFASGFTLIEYLVIITTSILLMSGVLQVFGFILKAYQKQTTLLLMQNMIIKLHSIFAHETKLAGYIGCARLENVTMHGLSLKNRFTGDDNSITVKYASPHASSIILQKSKSEILITKNSSFQVNGRFIIADCFHAEIALISYLHMDNKNLCLHVAKPLQYQYAASAEVAKLTMHKLFFAPSINQSFTLFLASGSQTSRILDDIKNYSIQFYLATNKKVTPQQIIDWSKVVAVKISLQLSKFGIIKPVVVFIPIGWQ